MAEFEVDISDEAIEWLLPRGGAVYLWQEPFGNSWVTDHWATEDPGAPFLFDTVWIDETPIQLRLERSLPEPTELVIALHHWPRRRLTIQWDGRPWGARGEGAGGGGDG